MNRKCNGDLFRVPRHRLFPTEAPHWLVSTLLGFNAYSTSSLPQGCKSGHGLVLNNTLPRVPGHSCVYSSLKSTVPKQNLVPLHFVVPAGSLTQHSKQNVVNSVNNGSLWMLLNRKLKKHILKTCSF